VRAIANHARLVIRHVHVRRRRHELRPCRYCSPRHRMAYNRNEHSHTLDDWWLYERGFRMHWMTWRAVLVVPVASPRHTIPLSSRRRGSKASMTCRAKFACPYRELPHAEDWNAMFLHNGVCDSIPKITLDHCAFGKSAAALRTALFNALVRSPHSRA